MNTGRARTRAVRLSLVLCLVIAVGTLTPGCRPKAPEVALPLAQPADPPPPALVAEWRIAQRLSPSAPGFEPSDGVIPFAAVPREPVTGTVFLGYWNLVAGTVSFDSVPLFRVKHEVRVRTWVLWDGGSRVGVITEPDPLVPGEPLLEDPNPAFAVDVVTAPSDAYADIAVCPSGTGELVVLDTGDLDWGGPEPVHLQILSAEGRDPAGRSYPLLLSGAVFPASLSVGNGRTEAIVFVKDGSVMGEGRFCRYVLEAGGLKADGSSPTLPVQFAGAGPTFGRAGNRVYVAEPVGPITYWDIASGEIVTDEVLSGLLKAYESAYAPDREHASPPRLHGYRGTLVAVYLPAAYAPVLDASGNEVSNDFYETMYVVALRDGQVVGEVICHRGKLIVKKDGVVTQEVDLAPEYTAEWQFPNAEAPEAP